MTNKNIIEVLERYGEHGRVGRSYAYFFLFILKVIDSYILQSIQDLQAYRPDLYKQQFKKMLNDARRSNRQLTEIIRTYARGNNNPDIKKIEQRYFKEVFVLYNTILKQSSTRWFKGDYEMAKICTRLDMSHVLLSYWQKMTCQLIDGLPYPLNKTTNNYEIFIERCKSHLHDFVVHPKVLPDVEVARLTPEAEDAFRGAFVPFVKAVTNIFSEMMELCE